MAKKKTAKAKNKKTSSDAAIESVFIETAKAAATYCGASERTVYSWVEKGMTRTPEGYYIKAVLDEWKEAGGRPGSGMLFDAKDRKETADADYKTIKAKLIAIELAVAEGKFLPAEEVEAGRVARIQAVKRALLGLGRRLAPQLSSISEPRLIEATVNDVVRQIITGFAGESFSTEHTASTEKKNN